MSGRSGRRSGVTPAEVALAELLERAVRRHRLTLVTKPSAELVDLRAVRRLTDKQAARRRVAAHADLAGLDIVDELTAGIDADVRDLTAQAASHADTLRIAARVAAAGGAVAFLGRLHAKLLWAPPGALVGSANFTNGGLVTNDEVMLEVTDPAAHAALGATARAMTDRAVPAGQYRLTRCPFLKSLGSWAGIGQDIGQTGLIPARLAPARAPPMPVPRAPVVRLSAELRGQLQALTRASSTPQALAFRSRLILRLAGDDQPANGTAAELGCSRNTAALWRTRFVRHGLAGLRDAPRSGRPPVFSPRRTARGPHPRERTHRRA